MSRFFLILLLFVSWQMAFGDVPGGRSPDGRFEVVNVDADKVAGRDYQNRESHFELRDKSGKTMASELSLEDLTFTLTDSPGIHVFDAAWKVLWRPDARFVAIETYTSKFATKTIVFFLDGKTFKRIKIPCDPTAKERETDEGWAHTHIEPLRWLKNGDLVLDITEGYHTKSDGGITGYFATIRFSGNPPKATKAYETKETNRD